MAWDDTKAPDDLIKSADWNAMVTDIKTRFLTADSDTNYTGSDCNGTSGAANRELDVTSGTPIMVIVDRQFLHPTVDFTVSGSVITFVIKIFDSQNITVWK